MPAVRLILAVIAAGIVGTVANSAVVAALTPNEFVPLVTSPGRNAVAIAVAVLLPVIYAMASGAVAAIIGVAALMVIPSLLAKLVFGIGAPWPFVLGVNAVYAIAAWAAYLGHRANGQRPSISRDRVRAARRGGGRDRPAGDRSLVPLRLRRRSGRVKLIGRDVLGRCGGRVRDAEGAPELLGCTVLRTADPDATTGSLAACLELGERPQ
jgi:hypothetical protein